MSIQGFPPGLARDKVNACFAAFGSVRSVAMKRDYCFVNMGSAAEAARARLALQGGLALGGRALVINFAKESENKEAKAGSPRGTHQEEITNNEPTNASEEALDNIYSDMPMTEESSVESSAQVDCEASISLENFEPSDEPESPEVTTFPPEVPVN